MRAQLILAIYGMVLSFSGTILGVANPDWWRNFSESGDSFHIRGRYSSFSQNNVYHLREKKLLSAFVP